MPLNVYTLSDSEKWDQTVRSFKNYDTYWLSGYVKAFYLHGDGDPMLFYYESSEIRAINVVMKCDIARDPHFTGRIPEGEYFDFATPYGYGGWLVERSADSAPASELFDAYESWLRESGIVAEFVRFHPMIGNHEACREYYEVVTLGEVVHMDLSSPETIYANLTSKNRNMVRKAEKNGVSIYNGRYPDIYRRFREIYNGTMDRDNADRYYYFEEQFYESILMDLPQNAQVFYAEKDGEVIAASIMLTANGYMNYHLSGSLREYSSLAPTNLLLFKAALWGCAQGCRTLYLGGGVGSGADSLFKFKRAFYRGDDLRRFRIGKRIHDREKYDRLCAMREPTESMFFPRYRA
ncbi:MAG: GNAT family N-acetyltransferase [Lachnospiraceae bacterium]|nr:GNAT family N-acetyltransferase [Lachnospiraceae bacterium]